MGMLNHLEWPLIELLQTKSAGVNGWLVRVDNTNSLKPKFRFHLVKNHFIALRYPCTSKTELSRRTIKFSGGFDWL